jgi:hypothetical protein
MDDRPDQRKPYWREADDGKDDDYDHFQDSHRSLSDKVERFLMHVVILGLVALTLVQTLHTNRTASRMLNLVEGLEGVPWEHVTAWTNDQQLAVPVTAAVTPIVLTVVCLTSRHVPEARLLVNGSPVGTFKDGSVSATVLPGQSVLIDGSQTSTVLSFRVVGPSNLLSPALGSSITTRQSIESLGVISAGGRK